ncbi:MAG: hypothetical protein WAS55_00940 [Saprospiraceae bacterium]|nr:hypothetical protein [Saprospiraceae bacterium]MBK9221727.1 hypothetical protein [Saprospiraceae bacterium]
MFKSLLRKEFLFEWRSLYQIGGLLSFLIGVSYLVYFFSGEINARHWNLMYWIIFLFLSFFGAARAYEDDNNRFKIYTHQLSSPLLLFLTKSFYLFLSLSVFGLLLNFILNGLLPIQNGFNISWIIVLLAVCLGFALLTAFTSFLSSHGQTKQVLMVVISLPLCFPLIGMAFSFTLDILSGQSLAAIYPKLYPIFAIDLLAMALVSLLLPLSWKN